MADTRAREWGLVRYEYIVSIFPSRPCTETFAIAASMRPWLSALAKGTAYRIDPTHTPSTRSNPSIPFGRVVEIRTPTLHSRCTPWPIFDWRLIYGAMRDTSETVKPKAEEQAIELPTERNDRGPLDAVVVLEQLRTGYIRFKGHVCELEARNGRALSESEYIAELHRARGTERDIVLSRLRVVVHENPDGANPLPKEIFRGPYDEW
jgi:hypothetical protein